MLRAPWFLCLLWCTTVFCYPFRQNCCGQLQAVQNCCGNVQVGSQPIQQIGCNGCCCQKACSNCANQSIIRPPCCQPVVQQQQQQAESCCQQCQTCIEQPKPTNNPTGNIIIGQYPAISTPCCQPQTTSKLTENADENQECNDNCAPQTPQQQQTVNPNCCLQTGNIRPVVQQIVRPVIQPIYQPIVRPIIRPVMLPIVRECCQFEQIAQPPPPPRPVCNPFCMGNAQCCRANWNYYGYAGYGQPVGK